MPRTPLKVSRSGGDQYLSLPDYALTASPANGTVGIHHHRPRLQENIHKTFLKRLEINAVGCRGDQKPHIRMHLSSFQDRRRHPQLVNTPVVAGTKKRLIDPDLIHLRKRLHIIHKMGLRHHRLYLREVILIYLHKRSIFITLIKILITSSMLFHKCRHFFIRLHNSGLCACLHRQIAQYKPVVHAEFMRSFARKLHDLIVTAISADIPDNGQNQIPWIYPFPEFSRQVKTDRLRHQNPGFSRHHRIQKIRAANPCSESAHRSIGTGMGIRPHNKLSRLHKILQHNLMADALSFVKRDAMLPGKLPHLFMRRGSFRILRRNIVIDNKYQLILIRNPRLFQLIMKHIDGQMRRPVIAHQIIHINRMYFTGLYTGHPCRPRYDLFS